MKESNLSSKEKIILENFEAKTQSAIKKDMDNLEKNKLNAIVKTDIGRIHKLLLVAKNQLEKNNENMVYYCYQKLMEFDIPKSILDENKKVFNSMKKIIDKLDQIKLQFIDFHSNMPPLNQKGFVSLDDFQKDVINNINRKITTIVQAPTSRR